MLDPLRATSGSPLSLLKRIRTKVNPGVERNITSFPQRRPFLGRYHAKFRRALGPSRASYNGINGRVFQGPRFRERIRVALATETRGAIYQPADTPYHIVYKKTSRRALDLRERDNQGGSYMMKCSLQFLSTPTADTPGTSLMLHFDRKRYLIGNVGEGTQRVTVQRKTGLIKVGDIFLTGTVGWENAGGVLGMVLTIADCTATSRENALQVLGEKKQKNVSRERLGEVDKGNEVKPLKEAEKPWLSIHGGKNITHLLATARRFIFRKGMPLHTHEYTAKRNAERKNWDPTWQDNWVRLWDMVIEPEGRCASPKKRRHDEFSEDESCKEQMPGETEDELDQIRQAVVSSMFNSEWRLDALFTRKLSTVQLPAAIFVRTEEGKVEKYSGPMPGDRGYDPDVEVMVRNPWPGALVDSLPPTTPSASSVCYIIKSQPRRGKFDAKAAIALGVKPGPNFRVLTEGQSVTTEGGTVVTPDMVLGPGKTGSGFAIIELPTTSYIGPLLNREEWSSKEVMHGIGAVIWILGPGVLHDARLQAFMQARSEMEHIVSSKDCCSNYLALESPAAAAIRLHLLDADRFPIPKYSNVVPHPTDPTMPYMAAKPSMTLQLEPRLEVQTDGIIPDFNTATVVKEVQNDAKLMELAKAARDEVMAPGYQQRLDERQKDIPSKDAEVVTLGTGSALPSKYRNVSATLLRVPGYGSYLFDCGENTLGQLKRVFGDELPEVLRDLKGIWISHLHADHHLGTVAVIKAWATETAEDELTKNNKLYVLSHEGMTKWLHEYSEIEDYGHKRVEIITFAPSNVRQFDFQSSLSDRQQKELGLVSFKACSVSHCHGAAAVVFEFANGFKVAYSGDCRPSREFIKLGKGVTLLIHEATFDDELKGDAIAKKHSTTSEALDVGRQMNARRILLTHFSQRYQKIPVMEAQGATDQVAIVAFDYMRVKIGDFAKVDAFRPALTKLYEDEVAKIGETGRN
ncbi:Metallo-hydrolase [Venustampulla echinocandica]|uniref:ribonuclease Z n=1 Tax=Venustampulla echinocandica TaxID=2656787 RepID=A0A370TYJ4_9HELO|nr:Metallo-hydrolase [Venustampulla echinocandica]RDL40578.1 Metallo-hydrolase [Venustampulla echinocandica]